MKQLIFVFCILALMCGCAQNKKLPPKEGRVTIQTQSANGTLKKSDSQVKPQSAQEINEWYQSLYNAQNKIPHTTVTSQNQRIWKTSAGKGISSDYITLPQPIIVKDVIYTLDARLNLQGTDASTGKKLFRTQLPLSKEAGIASIGLSYADDKIFVASGEGYLFALDMKGTLLWQKNTSLILRSAPLVYKNKIFLLSGNNEIIALSADNGDKLWSYKSIATDTNLMGMGQPSAYRDTLIVPFSSGDIIAFNIQNGSIRWADTLLSYRTFNQISDLTHVLGAPVIDEGIVYVIGNANRLAAFDVESGEEVFFLPIGGQTTPVISGNTLFVITNNNMLVALNKKDGSLFWETKLTSKSKKNVAWRMPIPVNNQLIVTSSDKDMLFVSMNDGKITTAQTSDRLFATPLTYNKHLLLYTEDADLILYK